MANFIIYMGQKGDGVTEVATWMAVNIENVDDQGFNVSDYFHPGTMNIEKMGELEIEGDTHLLPESFDVSGT